MESLIQTLLTMTATASVAAVCVMVLRLPLKRAPRWITCCLWLVVFLRMVCPTGLTLPVSLVPQAISNGASVERILPAIQEAAPVTSPSAPAEAAPDPDTQAAGTMTTTVVTQTTPEPAAPAWPAVLAGIWAVGAAAALLWATISYARLRRRIADAVRVEGNIYETDRIDTPFVCGFFRPRIYLPVTLDEADRRYVLLHEQAHLRRRDHWAKPLAYLALCVHWFNPVLWLSYRLLCRDIETACDQAVIRSFDRADTARYAAALLHLGQGPSLPAVVPLAFGEENATGRVRSVLSYKKPAFWAVLAAVAACVVAGVLLLSDGHHWMDTSDVTSVKVFAANEQVNLPKELTEELVGLMEDARLDEAEEHTDTAEPPYWQEGLVTFYKKLEPGKDASYSFLKDQDELILLVEHYAGGDVFSTKQYPVPQDFQTAYEAWQEKVDHYLWVTRPDQCYAAWHNALTDEEALVTLLNDMGLYPVMGPYSAAFDPNSPQHATLYLEFPAVLHIHQAAANDCFRAVSKLISVLSDGDLSVSWNFGPSDSPHSLGNFSWAMTNDPYDEEDFRALYARVKQTAAVYQQTTARKELHVAEILFLSPQAQVDAEQLQDAVYSVFFDSFRADLPAGDEIEGNYDDPYYRFSGDPAAGRFLAAHGVEASQFSGQAACTIIQNVYTRDTGYRLYTWDGCVFLAHFDLTGDQETPEYLVELSTAAY